MQIEIAEQAKMTVNGSALLRSIQNDHTPILDLLVREAIQNSLDANVPGGNYVGVDILTGTFSPKGINAYFDSIEETLNNQFTEKSYECIAIRDFNTTGLTGPARYSDVKNNEYGNFIKLVYDISKPQDGPGAGGSWGYGKTIYFRIGIGLVIYYSRIYNQQTEKYESRLAATLVEDELKPNRLLPENNEGIRRGIAWWGDACGNGSTMPVTDEKYIEDLLSKFSLMPYSGNETGTTIIIPYVDSDELLANNMPFNNEGDYDTFNFITPFWYASLADYLRIAVQRWYSPRIDNKYYPFGAYLKLLINGEEMNAEAMEPIFQIIQGLYNRAALQNSKVLDDYLGIFEGTVHVKNITINDTLNDRTAGWIAFMKVDARLLKMTQPYNKYPPYYYCNINSMSEESNQPIIFYTRKPSMIVAYETTGVWASGIQATQSNEYILGIFVLNSNSVITQNNMDTKLEEYIRLSETADHTSWHDHNLTIVDRIEKNVRNNIAKTFMPKEPVVENEHNAKLSKFFGGIFLPPTDFGHGPSLPSNAGSKNLVRENHRNYSFVINKEHMTYTNNILKIKLEVKAIKPLSRLRVCIGIDSETGVIKIAEWEKNMGLSTPFELNEATVNICSVNGEVCNRETLLDGIGSKLQYKGVDCVIIMNPNETRYAIDISCVTPRKFDVVMIEKISIKKNDVSPVFYVEE